MAEDKRDPLEGHPNRRLLDPEWDEQEQTRGLIEAVERVLAKRKAKAAPPPPAPEPKPTTPR